MTSFASCFKGTEAKSSMEIEISALAEEMSKNHQQGQEPPRRKSCVKCFCSLELDISSTMFS